MTGGRPRTGTPVLVRIPADVLARIDALAAKRDMTRAAWIREKLTFVVDELT